MIQLINFSLFCLLLCLGFHNDASTQSSMLVNLFPSNLDTCCPSTSFSDVMTFHHQLACL